MVSAQALNNNQTKNGIISDATPLVGADLYLDVTLNGNPVGLVHLGYDNGKLYAGVQTLRQLGFRIPQETSGPVNLNDIDQLNIDYNVQQQTLALTAPLNVLDLATTQLNPPAENAPMASSSRGALLNYDVYAQQGDESSFNTFSELRAFNSLGVLSTTQLTQYSTVANANNTFNRLDTSWRSSFPQDMLALTVGDTLTSSLAWSRPTHIGGIQIGTDFGLQPYMPTTPLPAYLGSATVPSNVELYVNGVRYYNGEVPAGSFQINTMPNISGAGTGQVMMTDALGRTTVQNFSFYNDQQLLRAGLTSWSAELGAVRENYGYSSFGYASVPVLSGTWRRGISNTFTADVHAETSDGLINAGFSNDWIPGSRSGTLSTALAASADSGKNGFLYSVGYRWSADKFNFSTTTTATSGDYRDVATHYGEPPPTLTSNTVIGYSMASAGNVSLSYLQFRYPHETAVRYANASWYKSVTDNVSLNAGFNQNIDDDRDRSIYLMVTVTTGNNLSASSTIQHTNNETGYQLNASQTPPADGGWGWNIAANQQASRQSGQGEVGYLGRYGKAYTGFSRLPDNHYGYAGVTGSLVTMGGGLFAAREINNGFAVVSTDGVPDVPVKLQNNLVGHSDDQGLLLVTSLNSYQSNQISIDPMDLPANMRISRVEANATPADRSGTLVSFGITPVRAAQVILVDVQGKAIPEGSMANATTGSGQSSVVGFDGMTWFDTLEQHNRLRVDTETGSCNVQFDYPPSAKGIVQIGPLVCR
ncbi:fimbrial biogenesis outer membrane usher protein [Citrobacter werkmanii]|nr:fimbria/pilus outer membrane usher protein [Citrobacter werkmanii]MBJ9599092.1 fimbrial biogenesis outer membrane usher protein [Citrobacter werkmanii]MBJ9872480.1 fimbrial biogenesis outer membrane usher protein [Citrobacter werkmanii]HEB0854524.1 fimbrial biogenesis outer membrane usher protein [Citrobacter freundii]